MKKYLAILLLLLSVGAHAQIQCVGDPNGKLRSVYIVPQLAANQLYSSWAPILDKVGLDTQQCFEIKIPATIPDFENAVLSGQADYAFMNPYHAVMAHRAQGYIPLIADDSKKLDGIIVVRKDSPIKNITELNNQKMAFPAPNAFAASLLVRSTLANKNIRIDPEYVKTHSNVYRSVIMGDVAAGGGVNNTFEREPKNVRDKLRILYTTPGYSPHPFAANPRIPKATRDSVVDAFVDLSITEKGRKMLDAAQIPQPIRVHYISDYAPLEALGLERFVQRGNN